MVKTVRELDMEVCCTLGMLNEHQAQRLANAGLYAYNHNLDTSEEFYDDIISTRSYDDRLKTLSNVRKANLTVCSGGIVGMGESVEDRCKMLLTLSQLNPVPESIPINALVAVEGTPMENLEPIPMWDIIRMVATTRIVIPQTTVRLSAGRTEMSQEGQALCFMAGAGSIFAGEKLLTTPNPDAYEDMDMFNALGLIPKRPFADGFVPEIKEEEVVAGEGIKWSRPGHRIEANVKYAELGKEKRKQ
jgi:biotin synthase